MNIIKKITGIAYCMVLHRMVYNYKRVLRLRLHIQIFQRNGQAYFMRLNVS